MIQEASNLIGVCLEVVKRIDHWCLLCTDSGGRKRYWVCRGDDEQLYVFKLNKSETLDILETVG
jgi:hypothetical protein